MTPAPLPAPSTKHLDVLDHPIPRADITVRLAQLSSTSSASSQGVSGTNTPKSTGTTGTTLWLGAQVMACYLADIFPPYSSSPPNAASGVRPPLDFSPDTRSTDDCSNVRKQQSRRKRVLELGAGVGYLSLALAHWGYEGTASDIEPVLSSVLAPNVESNLASGSFWNKGSVSCRLLDWMEVERSGSINLDSSRSVPKSVADDQSEEEEEDGFERFDFIVTTDTLYAPALVGPLWTTLRLLSAAQTPSQSSPPPIYIALENRDPSLIEAALDKGRNLGFELKRIALRRVEKAVEKAKWGWTRADWEGVEIWKARYRI